VLFFPQLIAGPIVLHREMGKQQAALREGHRSGVESFAPGVVIFAFGLFKKVFLADNIAHYADLAFMPNEPLMMLDAWAGSIAYMLQIFFDFSGYSEMAVGLGLMFGFKLPNNFLVPYTATSMAEFWKRWHITMTRFFTMYVYMRLWMNFRRWLRRSEFFKKRPQRRRRVRRYRSRADANHLLPVRPVARRRLDLHRLRPRQRRRPRHQPGLDNRADAPPSRPAGMGPHHAHDSHRPGLFPISRSRPGTLRPPPDVHAVGATAERSALARLLDAFRFSDPYLHSF
jgi:hypothetical protein